MAHPAAPRAKAAKALAEIPLARKPNVSVSRVWLLGHSTLTHRTHVTTQFAQDYTSARHRAAHSRKERVPAELPSESLQTVERPGRNLEQNQPGKEERGEESGERRGREREE